MTPFVLDASMSLAWCFDKSATLLSKHLFTELRAERTFAVTTRLWPYEVAAVLAFHERRQLITQTESAQFLDVLRRIHIRVEVYPANLICREILEVTRHFRLTGYDAAYLALAKRDRLPLATLDQELAAAAREAGISLVELT